ncbi:MAG: DUF29 domain-containing protein [Aphanizomenon flos-aquae Clear-A1]|jgi:hypothetical protein|uniref:DUF29 domain-containing protein n=1 Tax=Aphanizomenon flos-aquae WA102 TaxID=1710896 RepID=A0A1B7X702_APHFL|nr:DUF29 domain-containing protein [Aphanizomenon flos-aquae Clear-A1]OBQ23655.1 MAG: hypothetical protein AN488_04540 [Anabaena sp. WA113]OBQ45124.1 MAG: hypothetical protein AN484_03190 [Aphanizomenon flos-aquae WA102]
MNHQLYEQDFNLWRETLITQIKEKHFNDIDWEHLLLELDDMGKSEKRSFLSNLTILIAHLLKLTVQSDAPEMMKVSWYSSVTEHRFRIKKDLQENPSFKNYLHEVILVAYADAKKLAIKESKNAKLGVRKPNELEYPLDLPFTLEQLLDEDFYGDIVE